MNHQQRVAAVEEKRQEIIGLWYVCINGKQTKCLFCGRFGLSVATINAMKENGENLYKLHKYKQCMQFIDYSTDPVDPAKYKQCRYN